MDGKVLLLPRTGLTWCVCRKSIVDEVSYSHSTNGPTGRTVIREGPVFGLG